MRSALLWIVLNLLSREATAQHLPITLYSSQDGAPVIGANSVFQDKQGWLWFTDGFHVVRYDGHRFKNYYPARKVRLEFCFQVMEVDEEIWVLSYPHQLKVQGDSLVIWDSTRKSPFVVGSLRVSGKNYILGNDGLYYYEKGKIRDYIIDSSFHFAAVGAPIVSFNDSLLLSYNSAYQLVIFDIKNRSFGISPVRIDYLKKDHKGTIFFLEDRRVVSIIRGLYRINNKWTIQAEPYFPLPWKMTHSVAFEIDHSGNLWIAEQFRRLIRVSANKETVSFTEENGLPSLWFNQMLVDREGLLWITNNGGICKIRQSNWEHYTTNEGLSSNHVTFISEGEKDDLLFLGSQDGVNLFKKGKVVPLRKEGEIFQASFLQQVNEKIVYTKDIGLYQASLNENDFTIVDEKLLAKFDGPGTEMVRDKRGAIFMSVPNGIAAWYAGKSFFFPTKQVNFRRLMVDKRGNLWAGSFAEGVLQFAIEYNGESISLKQIDYLEKIKGIETALRSIRALAEDGKGNIIVGTRFNGVFYLRMRNNSVDSVMHFDDQNGLVSNTIWGIGVTKNDEVWIGTAMGLNQGRWSTGKFDIVDVSKLSQIYSTANIFVDRQNSVWVASHPGVSRLISDRSIQSRPFSVSITRVLLDGKSPGKSNQASFNYRQNNFILEFSSNSFLDEKSINYSYRLMRRENEAWTEPLAVHSVNYSSLKPGSYRFQVRARNVDDRWSDNIAEYVFEIRPPFWQTPWFIALMIVLVASAFYALYRYRIAQLLRLQQVRNNISRNLHDDIGASLSNINILNELAKRNMKDEAKAGLYLSKAGEDIQRISESLSDIVWNINPRYDDLENLFIRMKRYAADMLEGKNISAELLFPVVTHPVSLPMDQRRDFYLIFKEAVNNLVKYSRATQALVEVELNSHSIHLLIRDNGKGFDLNKTHPEASGGNGLYNMKQRADKWKGNMTIESLLGQGTVVKVSMRI